MGTKCLRQSPTPWEMSRPNLGKHPKQNLDVSGIKYIFKLWVRLRNLPNRSRSFLGKDGREIRLSRPLSSTFTILAHWLNTTDTNNYSVRTTGKWPFGDTVLKGSAPLVPLGDFGKYPNVSKPRIDGRHAPETFYQSLLALVLATLRFKRMSLEQFKVAKILRWSNFSTANS